MSTRRSHDRRDDRKKAIQDRIEKGKRKARGGGKSYLKSDLPDGLEIWKPKDGEHLIDILEYVAGKFDPITEKGKTTYCCQCAVHVRVGPTEDWAVCLLDNYNKRCPICEHRNKLRDQGADDEKWKALFPKSRTLYNVLVHDSKKEYRKGVQVWEVPHFYMEKHLLKLAKKIIRPGQEGRVDPYIYFPSPDRDEGKTISFEIEPAAGKESYPQFVGHAFVDRDYDIPTKLQDGVYVLDELIHIPTYDEVHELYWAGGKESGGDDGEDLEDLRDKLEDMDMDELEDYVGDNNLGIRIKRDWDEDDVVDAIMSSKQKDSERKSERSKSRSDKSKNECPEDFEFGTDFDTEKECDDCPEDSWVACSKASRKSERDKRKTGKRSLV